MLLILNKTQTKWHDVCVVGALPMEDIAKMADECMRDLDDDEDDSNLEDDEDLLVGLFLYIYISSLKGSVAPWLSRFSITKPFIHQPHGLKWFVHN